MSDMIEVPKIRIWLKTGQKPEADAPMLGFVRLKLVPLQTEVIERALQEDGEAEPPKGTP